MSLDQLDSVTLSQPLPFLGYNMVDDAQCPSGKYETAGLDMPIISILAEGVGILRALAFEIPLPEPNPILHPDDTVFAELPVGMLELTFHPQPVDEALLKPSVDVLELVLPPELVPVLQPELQLVEALPPKAINNVTTIAKHSIFRIFMADVLLLLIIFSLLVIQK